MRRSGARRLLMSGALAPWAALLLGGAAAFGASPSEGEIDRETPEFGWAGEAYETTEPVDPDSCPASSDPDDAICDHVLLTVGATERFWERHDGGVEIAIGWDSPGDDFDLYVYDEAGALVASSTSRLRTPAEAVVLEEPIGVFEIRVVPIDVGGVGYRGTAALTFERVPEPEPEPDPKPEPGPGSGPGGDNDGAGGGGDGATTRRPSDAGAYDFGDFASSSSGARAFDSRAFGLPSTVRTSERSVVPPELRAAEPPGQVFLPPAPVETVATSSGPPPRPTPGLLVAAGVALVLTALAVFDRLPREERHRGDGSAPARPTA